MQRFPNLCYGVSTVQFQSHEFITVLVHRKESLQNAPPVKFVKTVYVKIGDLCCMPVAICNQYDKFWQKKKILQRSPTCILGQPGAQRCNLPVSSLVDLLLPLERKLTKRTSVKFVKKVYVKNVLQLLFQYVISVV